MEGEHVADAVRAPQHLDACRRVAGRQGDLEHGGLLVVPGGIDGQIDALLREAIVTSLPIPDLVASPNQSGLPRWLISKWKGILVDWSSRWTVISAGMVLPGSRVERAGWVVRWRKRGRSKRSPATIRQSLSKGVPVTAKPYFNASTMVVALCFIMPA